MKDTRIYEKVAHELISLGCPIVLQFMCIGNSIMEKEVSPVGRESPTKYTVTTNQWFPTKKYKPISLEDVDYSEMIKKSRVTPTETYTTDRGVIAHYVSVLLESGYMVSDIQKGGIL